jgi:SSS family solute:Na+ symporter/sodium/proline symporter
MLYEIVPGVIISTLAIIIVSRLSKQPAPSVTQLFEEMQQQLKRLT